MSPEQAKSSKDVDSRSDIYSLGATLYFMATGRPPFDGETVLMIIQQHVYGKLMWPAEVNPAISEGTCRVIAKMMVKNPKGRYQEPKAVLRDIDMLRQGKRPAINDAAIGDSSVGFRGVVLEVPVASSGREHPLHRLQAPHGRERLARHGRRNTGRLAQAWTAMPRGAMAVVVAAVPLIGFVLVQFLAGGRSGAGQDEHTPSLPTRVGRGRDVLRAMPGQAQPERSSTISDNVARELDEISAAFDKSMSRQKKLRRWLDEILGRRELTRLARDRAQRLLDSLEDRCYELAEKALVKVHLDADKLRKRGEHRAALALYDALQFRFEGSRWLRWSGNKAISTSRTILAERFAAEEYSAITLARELLGAGKLDEARRFLSRRAEWAEHTRLLAEDIIRDIEERKASAGR